MYQDKIKSKAWNKVFWTSTSFLCNKKASLQTGTANLVENSPYVLHVITRVRYHKKRASQ